MRSRPKWPLKFGMAFDVRITYYEHLGNRIFWGPLVLVIVIANHSLRYI
jgi:hypothetical protein